MQRRIATINQSLIEEGDHTLVRSLERYLQEHEVLEGEFLQRFVLDMPEAKHTGIATISAKVAQAFLVESPYRLLLPSGELNLDKVAVRLTPTAALWGLLGPLRRRTVQGFSTSEIWVYFGDHNLLTTPVSWTNCTRW